jgi:hypothetical protein
MIDGGGRPAGHEHELLTQRFDAGFKYGFHAHRWPGAGGLDRTGGRTHLNYAPRRPRSKLAPGQRNSKIRADNLAAIR